MLYNYTNYKSQLLLTNYKSKCLFLQEKHLTGTVYIGVILFEQQWSEGPLRCSFMVVYLPSCVAGRLQRKSGPVSLHSLIEGRRV